MDGGETPELVDPFTAADQYRAAVELAARARANLIASASANRTEVNMRGLARRAGIYEGTLHTWITREVKNERASATA